MEMKWWSFVLLGIKVWGGELGEKSTVNCGENRFRTKNKRRIFTI